MSAPLLLFAFLVFAFAFRVKCAILRRMKCPAHQAEAVGVCVYCGRAMCADCGQVAAGQRFVCSEPCAAALARADGAGEMLLQKSLQSARASAVYSYLCGGLSAAAAVGAWFCLPVPFLVWFTAGCSAVFIASGIWYGRIARRQAKRWIVERPLFYGCGFLKMP
jgi:hypothetical protein